MIARTSRLRLCVVASFAVLLLVALGMFMAVCVAPSTAAKAAASIAAQAAAPTATPSAASAPACDPDPGTGLSIWGNTGIDPNFSLIASTFASAATGFSFAGPTPADIDFAQQMDHTMIGFYTGHGHPTYFDVVDTDPLGNPTMPVRKYVADLSLMGQCPSDSGGELRYLIQFSCNVFAHGPNVCDNSQNIGDYECPGKWRYESTGDRKEMRSIYARWGPVLGNGLRMACGSSTDIPPGARFLCGRRYAPPPAPVVCLSRIASWPA